MSCRGPFGLVVINPTTTGLLVRPSIEMLSVGSWIGSLVEKLRVRLSPYLAKSGFSLVEVILTLEMIGSTRSTKTEELSVV